MIKKLVKLVTIFLGTVSLLFLWTGHVLAQEWSDPKGELPAHFYDLEVVFGNVLGLFVAFAGVVVFAMLVIAGYQFMFSGGDPQKNAQARATITWAIIGLVLLLGLWLIFLFIEQFTGVNVSIFCIPGPDHNCSWQ